MIQETFKHFEPPGVIDIKDVSGGKLFMDGLWLCGYLPHPDMAFVGFTPNVAAMVRVLALGEVDSIIIDTSTLIAVSHDLVGPAFQNMDYLYEVLARMDGAQLTSLYANGVKMYRMKQRKGDLAFVPQGFLVIELSLVPHSMIYGMRKSFFTKTKVGAEGYKHLVKLHEASGRSTDRMNKLLEMMETA